ncbi:MAG: NAD(P)-dependent oxidoreductase [Chloroflexi bacterium]|nr:NAD(P)-dependent oxidoreductase [Chloroflexota bacterium]
MTQKVGFIGLGIMGSRMAANLLAAGYELTVHNRSKDKATELIAGGAMWADRPAEAAQDQAILITMLAHPEAVTSMMNGDNGFLNGLSEGALWVDCSTVNPSFVKGAAHIAAELGIRYIDAPVAGSKPQAAQGELVFFAGASDEDLREVSPLFEVMGSRVVHTGLPGTGSALKMVINSMLAMSMVAFSEAVALGESLGISRETLFNTLIGGPVTAPFLARKREMMESAEYDMQFPLRWMHKDLHLASISAFESGAAMPMANAAKELYQLALRSGYGDQDFAAIFDFVGHHSDE